MKTPRILTATTIALIALVIGLQIPIAAGAVTGQGSGEALEIYPPVKTLTADPGQTITTTITIRDVAANKLVVAGEVNDFGANGEDGTPKILLDTANQPSPYSLRDWVSPLTSIVLQPKQLKDMVVSIHVPKSASPGGYYGVIRFTGTPPDLQGSGVSLSASIGSLVFLRVNGAVKENMSLAEFSLNQGGGTSATLFQNTPINFVVRIKNDGNIYEQPVGVITITDMFKRTVATLNVNGEQRNVLPQSIRKFSQPLDSTVIGNRILFGMYHADLRVVYGANKQVVTASTTFWVIPYTLIGVGIIVLIIGFFALRYMIKRYNRHIIKQAQKRH